VEIEIREATTKDTPSVLYVYRETGLSSSGDLSPNETAAIWKRIQTYPNYKIYVAETEGKVLATFALIIIENLAHGGVRSGLVEAVAVLPEYQGQGIGKQMMQFAMNRCKDYRCYKMALSSNETRTEAHKFYENLGFSRHGTSFKVEL
jgi:GNAT superfamily N-acetyltransferase